MRIFKNYMLPVLSFLLLSGCATLQVAKEVQSGRSALKLNQPQKAISHFEAAARTNPDYLSDFTLLNIGISSYLGMAYYQAGEKQKALENFREAKQRHSNDHFARVFLGLTMSQTGQTRQGRSELIAGLSGLEGWLDETRRSNTDKAQYWDPGDYLKKEINETRQLLQGDEVDWREVDERVVTLAMNFDDEIDEVKRDWLFEDEEGESGSPSD